MTLYGLTKECPKNLSKKMKKVLTNRFPGGIIVRLSGARVTATAAENRITTAFEGFLKLQSLEKTSKKSQKSS